MTEKTWNWWGKPTPQEDILEDLVRLREHTGEWPKPGDVVGIRHIRTEVDWNYYFVGYRDAIRQASERWCQQRGQAPKKKRKKGGKMRASSDHVVINSSVSGDMGGENCRQGEPAMPDAPRKEAVNTAANTILDVEDTIMALMSAIRRCGGVLPTMTELDYFARTLPNFPTSHMVVSRLGPKMGWMSKIAEYKAVKQALCDD